MRVEQPKKILIIDDNESLSLMLEEYLRKNGYETDTAENGREGLEKVVLFQPDLLLLDIEMPVMDGWEFLKTFRGMPRYRTVPVVILSGLNNNEDIIRGLQMGAENYITKPFSPAVALWHIKNTFRITSRYASMNILTGFPMGANVYETIREMLNQDESFHLISFELNTFRVFNKYYRYLRGDSLIIYTADLLRKHFKGDYIGHLDEHCFVVLLKTKSYAEKLEKTLSAFDAGKGQFFDDEDRERGSMEYIDRQGSLRKYPLVTLVAGVVPEIHWQYTTAMELLDISTEVRMKAKSLGGSTCYADKRRRNAPNDHVADTLKIALFDQSAYNLRTIAHFLEPFPVELHSVGTLRELLEYHRDKQAAAVFLDIKVHKIEEVVMRLRKLELEEKLPDAFITVVADEVQQSEVLKLVKTGVSNIIAAPINKETVFISYRKIIQSRRRPE